MKFKRAISLIIFVVISLCSFSIDFSSNEKNIKGLLRKCFKSDNGSIITLFFFKYEDKVLVQLKLFNDRPFTIDSTLCYMVTNDYIYLCAGESMNFCKKFNFSKWNDSLKYEDLFSLSKIKKTPFPTEELFFEYKDSTLIYKPFIEEAERNALCEQLYLYKAAYQCDILPPPPPENAKNRRKSKCNKRRIFFSKSE